MNGRRGATAFVALVCAAVLSGCVSHASPAPSSSPTVDWAAKLSAFIAKYGSNPPSDAPYTEAQAMAVAAKSADTNWRYVLQQYPDAVRPTDSFVHWTSNNDPDRIACLTSAGWTFSDTGVAADGSTTQGGSAPATREAAVGTFDCEMVRYPVRQSPPPNPAQLGYYYEYLVHYFIPCYQAHGAKVDLGMPTKGQFIAQNQSDYTGARWYLTPPDAADAPDPTYDGPDAVCSSTGPGGAQQ